MATPRIYTAVADVLRPYRWALAVGGAGLFVMTTSGPEDGGRLLGLRAVMFSVALIGWGLACATFWFNSTSGRLTGPGSPGEP